MIGTYPQQRMIELNLTPAAIVRAMNRGKRLTPKQIENRARVVARVLREGNCGELYAKRVARILDIDACYLELPCKCWPSAWQGTKGTAKTAEPPLAASGGRGCSPARRTTPRPDPRRMEILRLVP